jgi:cobyrinic acid a,c-diamide synthase
LARHLRRRGLRVATAKAGPDFIDPGFHALASGQRCLNLDVWAMRRATVSGLVAELESAADIVLCEGVMGLFDGTGPEGETGSTAELAQLTGWPVVMIVDAHGQSASIAALLRGFAEHRPGVTLAGVIFNRVSSVRHGRLLAESVARHVPFLACLGTLPFDPRLTLPSRHLGLVPAVEIANAGAVIDRCAAEIGAVVEVDRLLDLARPSTLMAGAGAARLPGFGRRIAVARDEAFSFAYPALLNGWRHLGVKVAFFSPLADEPPDCAADSVYLPGGYPELWSERLASVHRFMTGLRQAAADGKPIYGECGGYMVLGEILVDSNGRSWPMAGLLPLATSFAERRLHLGYRYAKLLACNPLGTAGACYRGHEFHYATAIRQGPAAPLFAVEDASGADLGCYGLCRGSVFGSFIHLIDRCDE